ncbi:phosphoribosyl-ATP diphosphatase [Alphaproteobacteria bacterium]|nr:phosphoribosyl-ATP diphosphatase [Alphaproteobacteria bacterium]|tara:strand:- start:71 stop:397 length:327 start_codon:yes stop_codon:yes gene_type:complete
MKKNSEIIDKIFNVINNRKKTDSNSYVAQLKKSGISAISQKLGEESIETIVAALQKDKDQVIKESADLIFFLLVLLSELRIKPEEIYNELYKREGISGIDEKTSRVIK